MNENFTSAEIMEASDTTGELILGEYDPDAYAPYWHQRTELAFIIIADVLTLLIMFSRTYFRRVKMHSFRADDGWIMGAAVVMLMYFPMQIINNQAGTGLYWKNIHPDQYKTLWWSQNSWAGYYMICSMVKISMCCCHLHILPAHMVVYRRHVLALCVFIMSLGLFETFIWLFACTPVQSNFDYDIQADSCLSMDIERYIWVGLSCIIDLLILSIPFVIVRNAHLPPHKKRVLRWVFAANLLGTITCACSVYGVWYDRKENDEDMTWTEVPYIIMNNVEVLMYTLGASFPVLSPYLIAQSEARASSKRESASAGQRNSWRRMSKSNNKNTPPMRFADVNRVVTIGGTEPLDAAALDHELGLYRAASKGSSKGSRSSKSMGVSVNIEAVKKPSTAVVATDSTLHSGSTRNSAQPLLPPRNAGEDRIQGWTFAMIDEEEGAGMFDGPGWRDTVEKLDVNESEKKEQDRKTEEV